MAGPRIDQHYGDRAHAIVRERPYELTSVFGVGFHTADTIARAGGVPADSPARARAARPARARRGRAGRSTCLPVAELAAEAGGLLGGAPPDAELLARWSTTASS